jgi:small multidrug resistance family-3 protein
MRIALLFALAGLLEVGGGYLVWLALRERRAPVAVAAAGFVLLALDGLVPVFQCSPACGVGGSIASGPICATSPAWRSRSPGPPS